MNDPRLLIVHADSSARTLINSMLRSLNVTLEEADSDRAAVRRLDRGPLDVIVAGVDPEDPEALELVLYVKRKHPKLPVILLFSVGHAERCREARQRGAAAVLRFPVSATQLRAAIAQALGGEVACRPTSAGEPPEPAAEPTTVEADGWTVLGGRSAGAAVAELAVAEPTVAAPPRFVGEDESLRQAIELAETIAPTRAPVIVQGEGGTGKRRVARALHHQSSRRRGPFVEVRAADHPGEELDRVLFGERPLIGPPVQGKLNEAAGGTLYIDDVGALGPEGQARFLRLLRDGEFEPVGGNRPVEADVRLVFGTRSDLAEAVERGGFRQDLFYRISVVCLKLPPLRHRGGDVERLAEHFRARAARRTDRPVAGFSAEALGLLRRYPWPGNVQELEAAVERAVLLCRGRLIEPDDLGLNPHAAAAEARDAARRASNLKPLKEALEEPEKQIILTALEALGWNRQETARVLDINRTTLYKKMKKYGLLVDEPAWAN